jgi:hypothetical protein
MRFMEPVLINGAGISMLLPYNWQLLPSQNEVTKQAK